MNKSQINKLTILTENISRCNKCERLRKNGMAIPFWTKNSRYLILAEAPGGEEVLEHLQTPLVGEAGVLCWKILKSYKLYREDFVILNSIQCRPVENGRNGKPRTVEIDTCKFWTDKYIKISQPKAILAFGNYAMYYLFNEISGIKRSNGNIRYYHKIPVIPCLHPASLLYDRENKLKFKIAIKKFKGVIQNV